MKVKEIQTTKSTTFKLGNNDIWYKASFGITIELEPGDSVEEAKRKAWNTCSLEIEKQVEEILNAD